MKPYMVTIVTIFCMMALFVLGCHTLPDTSTFSALGKAGGSTTAIVMLTVEKSQEGGIDADVHNATADIVARVTQVIPQPGQTLEEAWTPIAQSHTDQLVKEGKITAIQGAAIMAGFKLIVTGFAALEERYPNIREYRDRIEAALNGFGDGFLSVYLPVNAETVKYAARPVAIDTHTYNRLQAVIHGR